MLIIKCIFTLGTLSCSPCLRWTVGAAAAAAAGGGGTSLRHSQSAGDKKMPDSSPHRGRRTLLSSFLQSFLSSCLFIPHSLSLSPSFASTGTNANSRARAIILEYSTCSRASRTHNHSGGCLRGKKKQNMHPSPSITAGSFSVAGIFKFSHLSGEISRWGGLFVWISCSKRQHCAAKCLRKITL